MTQRWHPFNHSSVRKLFKWGLMPNHLMIILRNDGKTYSGKILSENSIGLEGVFIQNWHMNQFVEYNQGPPKRFTVIELPELEIKVKDPALPIA